MHVIILHLWPHSNSMRKALLYSLHRRGNGGTKGWNRLVQGLVASKLQSRDSNPRIPDLCDCVKVSASHLALPVSVDRVLFRNVSGMIQRKGHHTDPGRVFPDSGVTLRASFPLFSVPLLYWLTRFIVRIKGDKGCKSAMADNKAIYFTLLHNCFLEERSPVVAESQCGIGVCVCLANPPLLTSRHTWTWTCSWFGRMVGGWAHDGWIFDQSWSALHDLGKVTSPS